MMTDIRLIMITATLRSLAIGAMSVIFGIYLSLIGLDELHIGFLITAGLTGMAAGNLVFSFLAERIGRRRTLMLITSMMAMAIVPLFFFRDFFLIAMAAFLGMINGMGRDRGAAQAIDQAVLAQSVLPQKRTFNFSLYTFLTDVGTGCGALLAAIPQTADDYQWSFIGYGFVLLMTTFLYPGMSARVESASGHKAERLSSRSKKLVTGFALLSMMDSIGGGLITRALLTYWFIHRFNADAGWVAVLFGASSFVNSVSYFAAAWLAKHIGLVRTMVFTHIPSSVLLCSVPWAPDFFTAVGLFIIREFFAPMDVPTRQSYLAAIVKDHERAAAAGVINFTRNASWAVGPTLAGWAMTISFSAPLYISGILKIIYDLSLWSAFRHIRPPEEESTK